MSSLEYEITAGKKTGSKLVYTNDHHLFSIKSSDRPSSALYVCHVKACSAKIKIEDAVCTYINSTHIHGSQENAYEEYKINDKVKERCGKETKRPRTIFDEECAESSLQLQYSKRQRSYQIHRRKGIPKNPKTVNEVKNYFEDKEILSRFGNSLNSEPKPFYKQTVVTTLFAYAIFCSELILRDLPEIRNWFIDGTFKVVPVGPFKQLLIIGIELESHMFPCFYVLMTKKSQAAYSHLFKTIEQTWSLKPTTISTDFEKALRNALKLQYPDAELIGCWFHFTQAILRKAKKIKGFCQFLKGNADAKKLYRKFKNLPLIREDKIDLAFTMFKNEAKHFGARFTTFIKYFEEEWIKCVGPKLFCVFLKLHRTNNLVESYNSNIRSKIPPSGCFFKFIEFLQNEEMIKSKDYITIRAGGTQVYAPPRKRNVIRDDFILKTQKKFEHDQRFSITAFFERMNELDDLESDDNESEYYSSSDDDDNTSFCVVCRVNSRSALIEPCNELKVCQICVKTLITCPTCGATITGTKNVFL